MVSNPSLSVTRVVAPHFGDSLSVPIVVAPHLGVSSPSLPVPSGSSSPWWSQVPVYLFLVVAPHLGGLKS